MESINMSKLNLSSVDLQKSDEIVHEAELTRLDENMLYEEDYVDSEYREDIWNNLLEQESERSPIHLQSPQLEFRGTLVQQLRDVSKKLGLSLSTLHTAVAQLDLFMDAHLLRSDRLTHVALACLSLAAKSEERFSKAPTLKALAKASSVKLCGRTFRQLEWMVGQHARWRLLAPTPVTYAALLARYLLTRRDVVRPTLAARLRRDAAKILDEYLDLTLSDVRLRVVECVVVGCACVWCARAAVGVAAWPAWLATLSGRTAETVAPVARLLHKMMDVVKSRETTVEVEEDQGYSSARTSPRDTTGSYSVLDLEDSRLASTERDLLRLPSVVDLSVGRLNSNNTTAYSISRSQRLVAASEDPTQVPTLRAVKRNGLETNIELDRKRIRMND